MLMDYERIHCKSEAYNQVRDVSKIQGYQDLTNRLLRDINEKLVKDLESVSNKLDRLEKIMGLTSGSDCDITKKLNKDLMLMGLAGEGLVDKRVMIVKTHYPERYGKTKFYSERAILLVRNPVDSITSLFNRIEQIKADHTFIEDFDAASLFIK